MLVWRGEACKDAMPTCTVALRNRQGVAYWVTTVGDTLFEACATALDFFEQAFWKGPKPQPDTVLEVPVVGSHKSYRVRASRVRTWQRAVEWARILSLFASLGISPIDPCPGNNRGS
jgi:hypothetical protein